MSLLYRHLVRNEQLRQITYKVADIKDLGGFFYDQVVFEYGKGDLDYFVSTYNAIANNLEALKEHMQSLVGDDRMISCLFKSSLICALAEKIYLGIDPELLIIEYTKLMNNYGESESNKTLSKLKDL